MMTDPMSDVFAALADPTRRAILARLAAGEATAGELAAPFPVSAQAISKHLNVLERAGLITRTREAQFRRCRIVPGPLREVAGWAEQYRRLWEERYDALDSYLDTLKEEQ
jgi:DNA-binding transcriptional ArsR family regulator